jgi:hypothetical protein
MAAAPAKLNYKIYQGSTFEQVFRWESQTKVYVPIDSIAKSAPCVITTQTQHNLPLGWRFRVVGAGGMKEINNGTDSYYTATDTSTMGITINQVNSLQYSNFTSGGVIEYNQSVNLEGLKGRMQVRKSVSSSEVIHQSNFDNREIMVNTTNKTISIELSAETTAGFDFSTAVYSLELYDTTGRVIPFLQGNLTLVQEITR